MSVSYINHFRNKYIAEVEERSYLRVDWALGSSEVIFHGQNEQVSVSFLATHVVASNLQ